MATTFRIPKAPHNVRSWLSYAPGLRSQGFSDVYELPPARRKAASDTVPEVAARA